MPMLIVTDDDFEKQVANVTVVSDSPTKLIAEVLPPSPRGRGKGNLEVPNTLRQLIGGEYVEDRAEGVALAKEFGISSPSASAYSVGATSTASYNTDRPNAPHIKNVKQAISKRAQGKLKRALAHISEDKLSVADAKDLSGIAKDMSVIVKNMENEANTANAANQPSFVIYAPRTIQENHFETVVVSE